MLRTRVFRLALVVTLTLCTAATVSQARLAPSSSSLTAAVKAQFRRKVLPAHNYRRTVWFSVMMQRLKPYIKRPKARRHLLQLVRSEAQQAEVPSSLVLAVINVESDFNPWAVSSTGAQGLMQIMPFWLKRIGRPHDNLFNPRTNLRLGCSILAWYLRRSHGNIPLALQSYYGRRYGDHYAERVLRLLTTRWAWR